MAKYHPQGHQRNYSYDFDSQTGPNNESCLEINFRACGLGNCARQLHGVINLDIINEQTDIFEQRLWSLYQTPRQISEDNSVFSSEELKQCLNLRNLHVIEEEEDTF
mgnify:CR=1 FL=1